MDSSTQTMADDAKSMNDLFGLVEKLTIQLNEKDQELQAKDKELATKEQQIKELSTDLTLEKARVDKLKAELDSAQEMIVIHQMGWESFPSPNLTYIIETQSGSQNGRFLYISVESQNYYLRSSGALRLGKFKFTKNSDGTFSIYTMVRGGNSPSSSQKKYLHTNTNSSRVEFTAIKSNAGKFVLFFHEQNHHIGLLVDICTLDGYFLCMDNDGYVVANSRTPPSPTDKFMITLCQF